MGGWTAVEACCRLYGVSVTGWGGRSAVGGLTSATATLPVVAHAATREHSKGGQCGHSCSEPCVQEGVANGSGSCSAWAQELWAAVAWLSQWRPGIGEAQLMLVLVASSATMTKRASHRECELAQRYLIDAP